MVITVIHGYLVISLVISNSITILNTICVHMCTYYLIYSIPHSSYPDSGLGQWVVAYTWPSWPPSDTFKCHPGPATLQYLHCRPLWRPLATWTTTGPLQDLGTNSRPRHIRQMCLISKHPRMAQKPCLIH